uniref:Ribosomal protein L5 n=1 Tax=Achlya hypogyna TaxID=1202772 RepID=S5TQ32_ACHHY|nr:ribosomal protein L5 [Achlya hypogyna]AGS55479.1 ribosomal protein L5 [Achlya hypogyna]
MNHLHNHYNHIITYDLINKFNLNNVFKIPTINKIILNIGLKNSNMEKKKMISIVLLLRLIVNQQVLNTKSKKNNIIFKIKKGDIMGCKVTLRKKNIYIFLEKLIIFILPNIKDFKGIYVNQKSSNILNFKIKNILNFFELEKEFLKFQNLPNIDISIHTNTKSYNYLYTLLNQYNIPIINKK